MGKTGKTIVLCVGMILIAFLCAFALHNGHDGAIFMSCVGLIGVFVGYGFGVKPEKPDIQKRLPFPALLLALGLCLASTGCATNVELCINHPKWGKVCAVRVDGKWFIKGDLSAEAAADVLDEIRKTEGEGK